MSGIGTMRARQYLARESARDRSAKLEGVEFYRTESGEYIWKCSPALRFPAKEAGFRFDGNRKLWATRDPAKARRLREHAGPELEAHFASLAKTEQENIEASRAMTADLDVPAPDGLEYRPFQKAGIEFILNRANTLLGDEMGTGKTIQAVGVINADETIRKILVVCPAALRLNWRNELEKWLTRPMSVGVAYGKEYPQTADVIICNYDILKKHRDALRAHEWDLLIVDECHYVKNQKAQRTQEILGKWVKGKGRTIEPIPARRKLFMSGSPMVNRPIELWGILSSLDRRTFHSFWDYAKRYCDARQGPFGWDMSGASNLPELQQKLRASIMIRRLKRDVLAELPAKIRQVIELPPNGCARVVRDETEAWNRQEDHIAELQAAVELAEASDDPEDYKRALEALREGMRIAFTEMSKIRHQTAVAKIPFVIEHARSALEEGNKLVIFAHHRDVLESLKAEFKDEAVLLYGGLSAAAQQEVVDRFQQDETVRVFLGQITAAGVGITLTAASHVVFAELDWVPGNLSQAEDRCHRIGQADSVLVQHLVFEGSLDSRMAHVLVEKQRNIEKAMDNDYGTSVPQMPVTPLNKKRVARAVQLDKISQVLTEADLEMIQACTRGLALMCDGAREIDGMGFNKIDAHLGRELAMKGIHTKRQAALAFMVTEKYKKQLGPEAEQFYAEIRERTKGEKE